MKKIILAILCALSIHTIATPVAQAESMQANVTCRASDGSIVFDGLVKFNAEDFRFSNDNAGFQLSGEKLERPISSYTADCSERYKIPLLSERDIRISCVSGIVEINRKGFCRGLRY